MKKIYIFLMMLAAFCLPGALRAQTLFSENFESGSMPTGWTTDGNGTWSVGTGDYSSSTGAGQGSYNAKITHGTTGNATKLITPEIDLSAVSSAVLSFMHVQRSWSGDIDQLRVYYRASSSDSWTLLEGQTYTSAISSWTTEEDIILPNLSSTYQIAFEHTDKYGYGLGIDNIVITQGASCVKPTGLAATLTPGNGTIATLNWNVGISETAWVLEYGTASDFTGATSVNVNGTPTANLTGLTAEQTYYARVNADCGGDVSEWSTTCEFTPTSQLYMNILGQNSSTNYYLPSQTNYDYSYTQQIYTADEMGNFPCTLKSVAFKGNNDAVCDLDIYLVNTNKSSFSGTTDYIAISDATLVFSGEVTFTANDWTTIAFDNDFDYEGGNIAIIVDDNSGNYTYGSTTWQTFNATGQALYFYQDNTDINPSSPSANSKGTPSVKNQITFGYELPSPYTKPQNLAVTNLTANSATITWEAPNSDVQSYKYQYREQGGTWSALTSTTALSASLSGLTGNTTYEFQVQAIYAGNNESVFASKTFTTPCAAFSVDPTAYIYGFEDAADMDCWELVNGDVNTNVWDNATMNYNYGYDPARTGDYSFMFFYVDYDDTDPEYQTLISPELTDIPSTGLHVEFYYVGDMVGYGQETFRVGYSTTDKQFSSFTWGSEIDNASTDYQRFSANYPAGTKYVAIQHTSDDQYYLFLDDFTFEGAASCLEPTAIAASNITTTSAEISWTAGASETAWDIYFTPDATDVPDDGTTPSMSDVTSSTLVLASGTLQPASTYYLYVRAACSSTEHSVWSTPVIFHTECEGMDLPYSYGFEDGALSVCWNVINTNTSYNSVSVGESNANTGTHSLNFFRGSVPGDLVAVLPVVGAYDLSDYQFEFSAKGSYAGYEITVGIMTDPSDLTTFEPQGSVITTTTSYAEYVVRFSNYTGSGKYVAIQVVRPSSVTYGSIYVDDIAINLLPSCIEPDGLTVSNETAHGATFGWTENATATAWQLYISNSNTEPSPTETNVIDADANLFTVASGLEPETDYYVWVRANCGTDGFSTWVGPETFTTTIACPVPTSLAVDNATITGHTADLSWAGTSGNYTVNYRTAAYLDNPVFSEEFNTNSIPTGWSRYSGLLNDVISGTALTSTTSGWTYTTYGLGQYNWKVNLWSTGVKYWMVTPSINIADDYVISFDAALTAYNSNNAPSTYPGTSSRFVVLASTDNMSSWTILREWNNSGSSDILNSISTTGDNFTIGLSAYSGNSVNIAFYCEQTVSGGDNDLHIDNVMIGESVAAGAWQTASATTESTTLSGLTAETTYEATLVSNCGSEGTSQPTASVFFTTDVACPAPTTLAAGTPEPEQVGLTWNTNGTETAWQISTGDDDNPIDVTTGFTVNGTTVTYTLTGLTAETPYTVKVRANCGGIDGESEWSNTVNFTTAANCPVPLLAASDITNITSHTADVAWTGFSQNDSYVVNYRVKEHMNGISENFSATPTGWLFRTGALNTDGTATLSGTSSWSRGTNCGVFDAHMYFNMYSTKNYWLITPSTTINNGDALSFDMAYTKYNSSGQNNPPATGCPTHRFAVLISTDDMATWTILREWNNSGSSYVLDNVSQTDENTGNIDLSAYAGETAHIAFFGHSETTSYDNNFHFDNVIIGTPVPAGAWQTVNVTAPTTSTTLSGLDAETPYEVYVTGHCAAGDVTTAASETQTFTTDIACKAPTALTAGTPTANSVELSWTESGTATAWQICLNGDETNLVDANSNPFTLTGLADGTGYTVKVRANCGGIDGTSIWSNTVSFTTQEACPSPTAVTVTDGSVNAYGATISWDGTGDSYIVMVGEENLAMNTNFENGSIDAVFTNDANYPWVVTDASQNNGHHGTYCIKSGNSGFHSSSSTITATVTLTNDGSISFLGGCFGEGTSWDKCIFSIDGVQQFAYGALQTWVTYLFPVTAGEHTFTWSFTKDSSTNGTGDAFFVDDIVISEGVSTWDGSRVATASPYNVTGLDPETSYLVKIKSVCGSDESAPSNSVNFTTQEACLTPTALTAGTPTANSVELNWTENGTATAWVVAYKPTTATDFTEVNVTTNPYTLTGLNDNTAYTVKVKANCGGIDGTSTWSNVANFTTLPSCQPITGLVYSNLTSTGVTLSWTDPNGTGNTYTIRNVTLDAEVATGLTATTYDITGLTPNADYMFSVVVNCSSTDISDVTNIAVTTPCAVVTVTDAAPYTEDFETGTFVCWTQEGAGNWNVGVGDYSTSTGTHSGNYNALINHSTTGNVTKLISPVFDITAVTNPQLNFWFINRSWSGDIDAFAVYYRPSTDAAWTQIEAITAGHGSWTEVTYPLSDASATYQLAFEMTDSYGYGVGVDDITIAAAPACPVPTDLVVNYTGGNTATATWDGTATSYNIDVNGTVTNNVTSPYEFAVNQSTSYDVMVQGVCTGATSDWTNAVTFTSSDCFDGYFVEYTLSDGYGDGWNGAAIYVNDSCGNTIETLTLSSGNSINGTLSLCNSYYEFVWNKGIYDGECSFTVTNHGSTLFEITGANGVANDSVLGTLGTISCPKPTDLAAGTPGADNVELSWTENGAATAWQIMLNDDDANLIMADANPFTLTGLDENTSYSVKVRAYCDATSQSCWSEETSFTTQQLFNITLATVTGGTIQADPAGPATVGTVITLTATPDAGYQFDGWSVQNTSTSAVVDVVSNQFTMPAGNVYVSATFSQIGYTVASTPTEGGSVSGTGTYHYNDVISLTAEPATGYHFVKWEDNSTSPTRTITVTGDVNVTATFSLTDYTITLASVTGGTIGSDPAGTATMGTNVTLTATPATGYTFDGWSVHNTSTSAVVDVVSNQFSMPAGNVYVNATFTLNSYAIAAAANPTFGGTVAGAGNYDHFATATLTATPETGYHFVSWTEGSTVVSPTSTYTFDVTGARTLVANFAINNYEIAAYDNPTVGGTVTGTGNYDHFAMDTLIATPATGYHFLNWTEGSTVVSTNDTLIFEVTAERTIVANFEINNYEIAASANPTVGGTVAGAGNYDHFATATLTATPATGYHFVNWTEGSTVVSTTSTYTPQVTGARTLVANFAINGYTFTVNANPTEGGTVTGAGDYDYNTTATLTATANNGYHFVNWTNANNEVLGDETTLSIQVVSDSTVTANFAITPAELSWNPDTFTGYALIDFNNYKPTLNNPHGVSVRYGIVEDNSIIVDPVNGTITNNFGTPILSTVGTFHIYAVHETDPTYYYDSVVYTLNVDPAGVIAIIKNIDEGGTIAFDNPVNDLTHAHHSSSGLMAYLAPGASTSATATAAEGFHFVKWQTGNNVDGYTDYTTDVSATVAVPTEITALYALGLKAIFDTNEYVVTATVNPTAGGTVSGTGTFKHFVPGTLTATANDGYQFVNWTNANGDILGTATTLEISAVSDTTVTANFDTLSYTITATVDPTVGGTVDGAGTYKHFTTATLTATPATGYHFVNWTNLNGDELGVNTTLDIDVVSDSAVKAVFAANDYNLTINYKYDNGTDAAPAYNNSVTYNTDYSVVSPTIATYMPDQIAIEGTMGAGNVEVTVTYTQVVMDTIFDQILCANAMTDAVDFSSTVTVGTMSYAWTNDNTAVGLAAEGTGNIAAFAALNTGNEAKTAIVTVTPTCTNDTLVVAGVPRTFTLTVNPVFNTPISAQICQGETYPFFGQDLGTTDVYTKTLQTVSGCDSIITLTLTVNVPTHADIYDSICAGLQYSRNNGFLINTTVAQAGQHLTYESTDAQYFTGGALTNAKGCDSTVTLHLYIKDCGDQSCGNTVYDIDLNAYGTIDIVNPQNNHHLCWMTSNFRSTRYADGTAIPFAMVYSSSISSDSAANLATYGRLYNWTSATRGNTTQPVQGVCPDGWHLPSAAEFNALINQYTVYELRSTDNWLLNSFSAPGTNASGFNMQPAGIYNAAKARCEHVCEACYYYTSEVIGGTTYVNLYSWCGCDQFSFELEPNPEDGYSVRCVKDLGVQ